MGVDALLFGACEFCCQARLRDLLYTGSINVLQNLFNMGSAMFVQGLCKGSIRCSSRGLGW